MGIISKYRQISEARKNRQLGRQVIREQRRQYPKNLRERFTNVTERQGNRIVNYPQKVISRTFSRPTPSSQQRFFKQRAKVLRGVQSAFPQTRIPGVKSQVQGQGRVKYGRGRPKGTFKYIIPGKGQASVFEYRRWLANQKQLLQMQLQQQIAMQKVARRFQPQLPQDIQQYPQQQVQIPQQQFNPYQQFQKPQFAGQSVMPVEPQPFKEISVLERTPINLSGRTFQPLQETYEEVDLMSGRSSIRSRNGGFI
jgi:hypothetical protein